MTESPIKTIQDERGRNEGLIDHNMMRLSTLADMRDIHT